MKLIKLIFLTINKKYEIQYKFTMNFVITNTKE